MKLKFLFTTILILTLFSFSLAYEMQEGQNFKAYLCIGKGTNENTEGNNFIADFDIGCLSEYYICWLLGFCGARLEKDIWGIINISLDKRAIRLIPEEPETINLKITIKNFSNDSASGKLTYYVRNLYTGIKVEEKEINISLNANEEKEITDSFTIEENINNYGDYKERANYQVVAILETIANDDPRNNKAAIDFTVLAKEKVVSVAEINPIVIILAGLILIKILNRR